MLSLPNEFAAMVMANLANWPAYGIRNLRESNMNNEKPKPSYKQLMDSQNWEFINDQLYAFMNINYPQFDPDTKKEYIAEARFRVYMGSRAWSPES
jgi:hypothetical protein